MTKERFEQLKSQLEEIIYELDAPIVEQYGSDSSEYETRIGDIVSGLYGAINVLSDYESYVKFEG